MNCPNCGRELQEGEVCTCTQTEPQAENTYYQPPQQGTYYDPNAAQNTAVVPAPAAEKIPARTDYPEGYKIKRKYAALILAATLGSLGIHNFYLGNNNKAIAQLLICLLGLFIFIGPVVTSIWALVEAVLILIDDIDRDAQGYKIMSFEESLAKEINKK